jgi:pantoate--beta-alanine ligase
MQIISSATVLQKTLAKEKDGIIPKRQKKIVLVPTMGALHEGHLKLIDRAKLLGDLVVVSIFVNPTQFGPNEDYEKYPREFQNDCKKSEEHGADFIFAPSVEEMYPSGFDTKINCGEITKVLEGEIRPGHFDGVCTVVLKLFNATLADIAVFGQKDAQQVMVIKRMVCDLNLPVLIDVHPTVRESDGLAMSSRNAYLTKNERAEVPMIYEGLTKASKLNVGANNYSPLLENFLREYYSSAKYFTVEYIAVREQFILIAARTSESKTRLIDNILI